MAMNVAHVYTVAVNEQRSMKEKKTGVELVRKGRYIACYVQTDFTNLQPLIVFQLFERSIHESIK